MSLLKIAKQKLKHAEEKLENLRQQWDRMDNHGSTPQLQNACSDEIDIVANDIMFFRKLIKKLEGNNDEN